MWSDSLILSTKLHCNCKLDQSPGARTFERIPVYLKGALVVTSQINDVLVTNRRKLIHLNVDGVIMCLTLSSPSSIPSAHHSGCACYFMHARFSVPISEGNSLGSGAVKICRRCMVVRSTTGTHNGRNNSSVGRTASSSSSRGGWFCDCMPMSSSSPPPSYLKQRSLLKTFHTRSGRQRYNGDRSSHVSQGAALSALSSISVLCI